MPETQIKVRPAVSGDIAVLTMLLKLLFSLETDFCFDASRQQKGLEMLLAHPLARVFVAEVEQMVIGMCSGQIVISTAEGGPALLVEDVVVRSDWQGRKAGSLLLDALSRWAIGKGISRLQLLADNTNQKALGFYKKLGWQTTNLIALRKYVKGDG
jgi:GNAT superfamily N-acetyltransferase